MLYDNPALKAAGHKPEIETIFVCESYQVTPGKTAGYWSLETIGLIRYFASYYRVPFYMFKSSDHKPLIKPEVIQRAGLWKSGQKHSNDAAGLAIYWLIKERKLLTRYLIND